MSWFRRFRQRFAQRQIAVVAVCVLNATICVAAAPQVTTIVPRAWKTGSNEVTFLGANLGASTRLLLDIPAATVVPKPGAAASANQLQMIVTVPETTPSGIYGVRAEAENGIGETQVVMVDQIPSIPEAEPNSTTAQAQLLALPTSVEGRLAGVESDIYAFDGKQGQRLVVEIAARRLGCNVKPVLQLFNAQRLELKTAQGSRQTGGDARFIATLPADGRYFIELHDLVYRGDNNQYRLFVGDFQVADTTFPLGARRGATADVQFMGGTAKEGTHKSVGLTDAGIGDVIGVSLPEGPNVSPLPLRLAVGDLEETIEQPAAEGALQMLTPPILVNGRISRAGEQDRFRVTVTPGSTWRFFVQSEQLGTPLDGVLELRNEQGAANAAPLATQDDGPGTADPDLLFTVPAGVTGLVVSLADLHGRGGEEFGYRLGVEPATGGDFQLSLLAPIINIPAGGSASVRVRAVRRNFNDAIRLKVVGEIPQGLQVSGAEIGAGGTDTFLSLSAPADTALRAGTLSIIGESGPIDKPMLVRTAKLAIQPLFEGLPWLKDRFSGAVTPAGGFALDVEPVEPAILLGVEYAAKVKARRAPGQTGQINLTFQSTQVVLPGQVPLVPAGNLMIAENANEATVKVSVQPNVTQTPLAYVITGQLLDAKDKKTVVATAEGPGVATRITIPFSLEAHAPTELTRGTRTWITAKLVRLGSFNQAVQVSLSGLPGNVRTLSPLTIPAGVSEIRIPVAISPGHAPGPLAKVKISGTWLTGPPVVSPPLDVALTVASADPPATLEIFDEGADFVAALKEGSGAASLETADAFSGKESVAVKPDQKSRAVLPGLGAPIVETPGAGQYRYLRFAWKKKGGTGVMLQLANNGKFGELNSKGSDYRYVAGIDKLNSKAVRVGEQMPSEWTVVTRDLYADHGAFTLSGLGLTAFDGEAALFDHISLARSENDFPSLPSR